MTTATTTPTSSIDAVLAQFAGRRSVHPTSCECEACAAHRASELAFWNAGFDGTDLVGSDGTDPAPARRPRGNGTGRGTPAPARVVANRYGGTCDRCKGDVAANAGRIEKVDGRWLVFHLDGECPAPRTPAATPAAAAPVDGIDLRPLESMTSRGIIRLAVPGGETRLKVRVKFAPNGTIYVDDAAVYGEGQFYGSQKPGQAYRGKIAEALRAILADPMAAAIRYTELTEKCAVCGRHLEDKSSVERGIGPVCWAKIGG